MKYCFIWCIESWRVTLACFVFIRVGCQLVRWYMSDSTRETCQGLMLCDPLETGLRRTSPYDTQVARLRVDTTPDVDASGETESVHHPSFHWEIALMLRWRGFPRRVLIILWPRFVLTWSEMLLSGNVMMMGWFLGSCIDVAPFKLGRCHANVSMWLRCL